jgi:2,4-dienoyl-CoA reductase (NADPH2)
VAIVGAGGIGFDVAEYLVQDGDSPTEDLDAWLTEWGVADPAVQRGGLAPQGRQPTQPAREVTLLQRKDGRPGKSLGKTTGWIHRASLRMKRVKMIGSVTYECIDQDGLHILVDGQPHLVPADTVVLCAGQEPHRPLADQLAKSGVGTHIVGGADVAAELDAKRAIDQAVRLAASL